MKQTLLKQSYRDYFLFVLGINSGMRISDMLPLRVCDMRDTPYIITTEQKTGKEKRFFINEALRAEADQYMYTMRDTEYLFPSRRGGHISRVQAYRIVRQAATDIGIHSVGTHTLRKTFGYHFYQKTKDVALLQQLFNHASPSITLRYIGINQDVMDRSVADFSL